MRILIAGGSGFLGRQLARSLQAAGHDIVILTRRPVSGSPATATTPRTVTWTPDGQVGPWARACDGTDVIVNLAGESIASGRWFAARKRALLDSRVLPTRSLARYVEEAPSRPSAFISSSAIGYYGDRGEETLTESSHEGQDFLAELAVAWEREARAAARPTTRVAIVRTGIVLDPAEGALAKLLLPFKLGAGGPFGSGRQFMSWIHRDDWVSLVTWLVESTGLAGPFNAVSPTPVANRVFATTLGKVLHRPSFVPTPGFVLRMALGEMAGPLLLSSQRVLPAAAQQAGFVFHFPELEPALRDLLR